MDPTTLGRKLTTKSDVPKYPNIEHDSRIRFDYNCWKANQRERASCIWDCCSNLDKLLMVRHSVAGLESYLMGLTSKTWFQMEIIMI